MIFFIRLCRLVALRIINMFKIFHLRDDFYILLYKATKGHSRIKKIIDFHHQFFKSYQTPSALMLKTIFIFRTWTPNMYSHALAMPCIKGIESNLEAISLLFCVKNKIAKEIHSIKSRTVLLQIQVVFFFGKGACNSQKCLHLL